MTEELKLRVVEMNLMKILILIVNAMFCIFFVVIAIVIADAVVVITEKRPH